MPRKIEISHRTIIFTVIFLGSLWFLYSIRDIVLQIFVALLLVSIINPLVVKLSKYKIPKIISILLTYILIFGIFGVVISSIAPPLIEQTTNLVNNLPNYLQNISLPKYINGDLINQFVSQLGSVPSQIVKVGFLLFGNILSILSVLIFAFYLLLVREKFDVNLEFLFGKEKTKNIIILVDSLEKKLGGWARGQFLLMLSIGILSYVGFIILGIPYALPLALIAGTLEIIPYVGPIVAAIPAIILGFSISPFLGFAAVGLAVLIQQLENYVFVPKIMEKSTGVSPIIVLLSLAVGLRLAGISGMIISIPIVLIIQTLLEYRFKRE